MTDTNVSHLNKGIILRFMNEALAQFIKPSSSHPNYGNLAFYTFVRLREAGLLPEAGLADIPVRSPSDLSNEHPLMILFAEAYYHLFLSGYIAPRPPVVGQRFDLDSFVVTDVGRRWVAGSSDLLPEDHQGYLAMLNTLVPTLDTGIQQYVQEALVTYERHALFASAVMIGAASERAMYLLMEALHHAVIDPVRKETIRKIIKEERSLSKMFRHLRDNINRAKNANTMGANNVSPMPYDVHENADHYLFAIEDAIRVQRNEAVHPNTGGRVQRESVRLALSAFPYACKKIYDLIHSIPLPITKS